MVEQCSTCKYSFPCTDRDPFLCRCRRYPPEFLYQENNDDDRDWYGQPIAGTDNWCGEYKQKEK